MRSLLGGAGQVQVRYQNGSALFVDGALCPVTAAMKGAALSCAAYFFVAFRL